MVLTRHAPVPPFWVNEYTVASLSVSVYPITVLPLSTAARVAYRPDGGVNDQFALRPNTTSCPFGYVTCTADTAPAGSRICVARESSMLVHPVPNALPRRTSRLL